MRVLERGRIPEGEAGMATRESGFKREREREIVGKFDGGVVDWRKEKGDYWEK